MRNKLEMELRSGERMIWSAQPIPKSFQRGSWGLVLFGIPWTAFSIFWVGAASFGTWKVGNGWFSLFPLFGLPFVLIGIGMLTSPYWMRKKATRTLYAITDQRAIVLSQGFRGRMTIQSFAPTELQSTSREENNDGSGDIIFTTRTWRDSDGDRRTQRTGFTGVPDVKRVEELIRELALKAPKAAA